MGTFTLSPKSLSTPISELNLCSNLFLLWQIGTWFLYWIFFRWKYTKSKQFLFRYHVPISHNWQKFEQRSSWEIWGLKEDFLEAVYVVFWYTKFFCPLQFDLWGLILPIMTNLTQIGETKFEPWHTEIKWNTSKYAKLQNFWAYSNTK